MSRAAATSPSSVATRLTAFILERHPFALASVQSALDTVRQSIGESEASIEGVRRKFAHDLFGDGHDLRLGQVPRPEVGKPGRERLEHDDLVVLFPRERTPVL